MKKIIEENLYSQIVESDEILEGKGIFTLGNNKYLIYKYPKTGFNTENISVDDALKVLNLDFNKKQIAIGLDIIDGGRYQGPSMDLSIGIFGITTSGKTVLTKWLMYQLAHSKNNEFILLGKEDLLTFKDNKKVKGIYNVSDFTNKENFYRFLSNIWLNILERKQKIEQNSNLIVIMDEYETLRDFVSPSLEGGTNEFDTIMKTLANYARAFKVSFIFGSQNYTKHTVGNLKDFIGDAFIGFTKSVQEDFITTNKENLTSRIQGTYLFYSNITETYLKIPFDKDIDEKINEVSNKNLLSDNNTDNKEELIDNVISKSEINSTTFTDVKNIEKLFGLK